MTAINSTFIDTLEALRPKSHPNTPTASYAVATPRALTTNPFAPVPRPLPQRNPERANAAARCRSVADPLAPEKLVGHCLTTRTITPGCSSK